MASDISLDESRKIMSVATDMRPDENVHRDPGMAPASVANGRPVSAKESARIMALATNIRPLENIHAHDDDEGDDD
jgi:hypothetical protein